MGRYELTDEQYELIGDLLPRNGKRGGQWNEHRTTLNGMFWILHSGAQWREMPERYGRWQSVYDRFNRWRKDGTVDRILRRLQMRLDREGESIGICGASTVRMCEPVDRPQEPEG